MHERIRRFSETGKIADDTHFWRIKETFIDLIEERMRGRGYVPHLDLNPGWTTERLEDGSYDFKITMYGVYVGKEISLAKEPTAYSDGKLLRIR